MNREDIIRMAEEAGSHEYGPRTRNWSFELTQLERFAALVAASERKTCVKICRSEADRALFNFQNDLPQNEPFWNGAEQMASSCENLIRSRGNA